MKTKRLPVEAQAKIIQSPELLREYAHRWYDEVWNERRIGAINQFMREDWEHPVKRNGSRKPFMKSQFKEFHQQMLEAFPDLWFSVADVLVEGDWTAIRFVVSGSHTGELAGYEPSGRAFRSTGMVMVRWEDGKAVECLYNYDQFGMLRQLGIVRPAMRLPHSP
jgi:predicted ester cyclase